MRTSARLLLCRITAATFLGAGAFLLVATYSPLLNPILFDFEKDEQGPTVHVILSQIIGEWHQPYDYYLIGTALSLVLLGAAWHFNIKAMRLSGELDE